MKLRRLLLLGLLGWVSTVSSSYASDSKSLGLGLILGQPTGLVGKYFHDSKHALDFGFAYSFYGYALVYVDYLFQFPGAFSKSDPKVKPLSPYVGIGGVLFMSGSTGLGVRIPLGLEWMIHDPRIGIFAEIVPGIALIPSTGGFAQGGIGARYYF